MLQLPHEPRIPSFSHVIDLLMRSLQMERKNFGKKTASGTCNYRSETVIYCLIHGAIVRIGNFAKPMLNY